jgi:hypothetical protein
MLSVSACCYGVAACLFIGTTSVPVAYTGAFVWGVSGVLSGAIALTALQRIAPVHAHGRVLGVTATIQSWIETIGLPVGGVTLAALGTRNGALALAGVPVIVGVACLGSVTAHPVQPSRDRASEISPAGQSAAKSRG